MKTANVYRDLKAKEHRETIARQDGGPEAFDMPESALAELDFKSGFDCAIAYNEERVINVKTMTRDQKRQITRRVELLSKRIVENPYKDMSYDKAELSAIMCLVKINDFLAEYKAVK